MFALYEKFIDTYKNGTNSEFEAAAFNFISAEPENKFEGEGAELLFKAGIMYRRWRTQSISCKHARKEMFVLLKQLADMDLPNPYDKPEEEEVIEPEPEVVEPEPETVEPEPEVVEEVVNEKPVHVLGVVPEEKKSFFSRHKK